MAYRCNPCRHTSAPFPIARSEWDMHQNARFCPDCQSDYTMAANKYPPHPRPKGNCGCGCKPCCCRPMCDYKPYKPPMRMDPCFPPHPGVSVPGCLIKPCVKPQPPTPTPVPVAPVPVAPVPVAPKPPVNASTSLASLFFFQ